MKVIKKEMEASTIYVLSVVLEELMKPNYIQIYGHSAAIFSLYLHYILNHYVHVAKKIGVR